MSILKFDLQEPAGSKFCHECRHEFTPGEPCMEISLVDPWERPGDQTVLCFECFMDKPEELDVLRSDFAIACELARPPVAVLQQEVSK